MLPIRFARVIAVGTCLVAMGATPGFGQTTTTTGGSGGSGGGTSGGGGSGGGGSERRPPSVDNSRDKTGKANGELAWNAKTKRAPSAEIDKTGGQKMVARKNGAMAETVAGHEQAAKGVSAKANSKSQ